MKFCTNYLIVVCQVFISSDLIILNLIASWQSFCVFLIRHSHSRIFALISFKFSGKVQNCLWTLTFENRQIRLIPSTVMADRVFKKLPLIQICWSQLWRYFVLYLNIFWWKLKPRQRRPAFFENFLLHDDNYNKSAYLNHIL